MLGNLDLLTLLSLVVAVVVILKLRSVLGKRTGDEQARFEQRARAQQEALERAQNRDKVVTLPRRQREAAVAPSREEAEARAEAEERIRTFGGGDAKLEQGLMQVFRADPSFEPKHFVDGAKQAYEMIVTAFAEGNRKLLKDLLSKEVYEGFAQAIQERETRGEQIDQSFVGLNKADIIEAEERGGVASITVKFVSQLISARRDRSGEIIEGDSHKIREVTDIWTFSRETNSRNPNWRLVATQAPN